MIKKTATLSAIATLALWAFSGTAQAASATVTVTCTMPVQLTALVPSIFSRPGFINPKAASGTTKTIAKYTAKGVGKAEDKSGDGFSARLKADSLARAYVNIDASAWGSRTQDNYKFKNPRYKNFKVIKGKTTCK